MSWSADDRDKALWRRVRARAACPDCKTRPEEWDPRVGGHVHAYVPVKRRCRGCEVSEAAQSSITAADGRGMQIVLKPREVRRGEPA